LHSLRTQLFAGAVGLLVVTIAAVGYALIVHQKRLLTREMEQTVALHGRNVALSSAKSLLRADPEFELYPLVTRVLEEVPQIESLVVVDAGGIIQGHADLVMIGRDFTPDLAGYGPAPAAAVRGDERLLEDHGTFVFITPLLNAGHAMGTVYLTYSKGELRAAISAAVRLILGLSAGALAVGLLLSVVFFRHISRPMEIMIEGVGVLAGGNLEARIDMPTKNEFGILADSFNDMARRIRGAQAELVSKERMDRELEIARDIQQSLIPKDVVPPGGYDIGHHYQSANEVGGDYLDVIPLAGGRVGLVMGDVSGKGVPGLVVMAMVKILVQEFFTQSASPRDVLCSLNAALCRHMRRNMFVTMFVAVLDPDRHRVTVSNAGHNPLVIYNAQAGVARMFKMEGVPLGAFCNDEFARTVRDYQLAVAPGDVLLQYTDGLNESRNAAGRAFSLARVRDITSLYGRYGANVVVDKLVVEEKRLREGGPQLDDITLLGVGAVSGSRKSVEEAVL
jgi:serine phosphatase RsbU (regulator of sigma subunit)